MLYQTHIIRALYTQRVYIDKNLLYCFDVLIVVHNIYQKYTSDEKISEVSKVITPRRRNVVMSCCGAVRIWKISYSWVS